MASSPINSVSPNALRKVIAAASLGNFVEWFDFAAYGFLATVMTRVFFPEDSSYLALLKAFAVFAVGFAFRPLGGIFFGILGDRIGRKRTLALTILTMAGATTLIGLLPSYAQAGMLAPALLTVIRCLQGFSAGGEYAGACAYVMESAPPGKRGRYGGYIPVSSFLAFATAATLAYVLTNQLTTAQLDGWGWRIPFLASAPLGLIGIYLRLKLDESPAFMVVEQQHTISASPFTETLRTQGRKILALTAVVSVTALAFYIVTTYFTTYIRLHGGMLEASALQIAVISLVFAAVCSPFVGIFTDIVGRRKTIVIVCIYLMVSVYPCFALAGSGNFGWTLLGMMVLALAAVTLEVLAVTLLSEVFPTRMRYTASALSYNLAFTIFGGTAPLAATFLIHLTGDVLAPAGYLIAICVLGMIGGLTFKETSNISLDHVDDDLPNPLLSPLPAEKP